MPKNAKITKKKILISSGIFYDLFRKELIYTKENNFTSMLQIEKKELIPKLIQNGGNFKQKSYFFAFVNIFLLKSEKLKSAGSF